jgi:tetratricopeptide (TPR) repeat protein
MSMIDRGGYEDADTTRDVEQTAYDLDRPAQSTMPQAVDGPGVSVEADLQRAIRKDESSIANYLKLGDFYRREKRLEEAAATLRTALDVSGGDQSIREQVEDVELDQLKHNLELAEEAVRSNGEDKTARKNATALAKELLQREIGIFNSRIERYPQDSRLKFDLAQRYMRTKKWSEAIPQLQQASADTRLECDVLVALGECFLNDKKERLGRRQFEKACEKVNQHDRPDLFLKTHYVLGRLCQKAGQREQAEDHYNEVLAVEYNYRDTLKRLEKLQAGDEGDESVSPG